MNDFITTPLRPGDLLARGYFILPHGWAILCQAERLSWLSVYFSKPAALFEGSRDGSYWSRQSKDDCGGFVAFLNTGAV
jgi:hypothetical protein